jgi:hypothetical protein
MRGREVTNCPRALGLPGLAPFHGADYCEQEQEQGEKLPAFRFRGPSSRAYEQKQL